jgi:hypothetical protein
MGGAGVFNRRNRILVFIDYYSVEDNLYIKQAPPAITFTSSFRDQGNRGRRCCFAIACVSGGDSL